jgi:Ca2+-binding EF-hand superfamily protein
MVIHDLKKDFKITRNKVIVYKKKFQELDLNEDGFLGIQEFKTFLGKLGFDNKKINNAILNEIDSNDDKQVNINGNLKTF